MSLQGFRNSMTMQAYLKIKLSKIEKHATSYCVIRARKRYYGLLLTQCFAFYSRMLILKNLADIPCKQYINQARFNLPRSQASKQNFNYLKNCLVNKPPWNALPRAFVFGGGNIIWYFVNWYWYVLKHIFIVYRLMLYLPFFVNHFKVHSTKYSGDSKYLYYTLFCGRILRCRKILCQFFIKRS